jgi:hypothetical protein
VAVTVESVPRVNEFIATEVGEGVVETARDAAVGAAAAP